MALLALHYKTAPKKVSAMETPTDKQMRDRARYQQHREEIIRRNADYKEENRQKVRAQNAEYMRKRRATETDPQFKLREKQRGIFRQFMDVRGRRNSDTLRMRTWVGITPQELRRQFQSQFQDDWNFSNFGTVWVIDHIIPLVKFNLESPEECAKAWHHTNLRPLGRSENAVKGNTDDRE